MRLLSVGEQMIAKILSEFENGLTEEIKAHSAALINLIDALKVADPTGIAQAQALILEAAKAAIAAATPAPEPTPAVVPAA